MHRTARDHGLTGLARSIDDLLLVETEHGRHQWVPTHAQSAAARAGLAVGDAITAVDGTPVAELTFTRLHSLLNRPGASFALTVHRGAQSLALALANPPATSP